jgi:hypothetical protein
MSSIRLLAPLVLAPVLAAAGCQFEAPSFDGTRFRCEPPDERCPDGFHCENGQCVTGDLDGPPAGVDGDGAPGPDGAVDLQPTFGDRPDADHQGVTDDATLDEDTPDPPRGAFDYLEIDAGPQRVMVMRFDVSSLPTTATVIAAELELDVFDPLENGAFEAYEVKQSWVEPTVTWNVRDTGVPWGGLGASGASRGITRIATFSPRNIGTAVVSLNTAEVQSWIVTPGANHGLVWISTSPDGRGGQITSSESSNILQRPLLRLTLAP